MKKLKMSRGVTLTFEEGCNKYLENCRQRNLRDGTINHNRQSYRFGLVFVTDAITAVILEQLSELVLYI